MKYGFWYLFPSKYGSFKSVSRIHDAPSHRLGLPARHPLGFAASTVTFPLSLLSTRSKERQRFLITFLAERGCLHGE